MLDFALISQYIATEFLVIWVNRSIADVKLTEKSYFPAVTWKLPATLFNSSEPRNLQAFLCPGGLGPSLDGENSSRVRKNEKQYGYDAIVIKK